MGEKIRKNLHRIVRGVFFRAYCAVDYVWCHSYYYVTRVFKKKEYKKLEKFKDKYLGERVFLIGTGPSLSLDDVKKLSGEYTFALNSFVGVGEELGFETSFYGFTDVTVLNKFHEEKVLNLEKSIIFFPSRLGYNKKKKRELCKKETSYEYPMLDVGQWGNFAKSVPAGFSEDVTKNVYFGYTCAYAMMQMIVYMGFKEIYLLGMDCSEKPGVCNFGDTRTKEEIAKGTNDGSYYIIAWKKAKEYTDLHGIKVYNATRGGELEVFPRVDFDRIDFHINGTAK